MTNTNDCFVLFCTSDTRRRCNRGRHMTSRLCLGSRFQHLAPARLFLICKTVLSAAFQKNGGALIFLRRISFFLGIFAILGSLSTNCLAFAHVSLMVTSCPRLVLVFSMLLINWIFYFRVSTVNDMTSDDCTEVDLCRKFVYLTIHLPFVAKGD